MNDGTVDSTATYTMTVDVTAEANNPASGQPEISGVPQVGQTLTALQGTITDSDGLTTKTFPDDYTFQWILVDGMTEDDIASATSSTYTPVAADVGKTLKVKVDFTDDLGNDESLTSAAYPSTGSVRAAASACPVDYSWCATMTVGITDDIFSGIRKERIGFRSGVNHGSLSQGVFMHDSPKVRGRTGVLV